MGDSEILQNLIDSYQFHLDYTNLMLKGTNTAQTKKFYLSQINDFTNIINALNNALKLVKEKNHIAT